MVNDGKVIISLFLPKTSKDVVLNQNGKILDKYCISLNGECDLAGNFRLTGNFINKDEIYKIINEGTILKVRNEYGEDEIFRITTVTPTPFIISIIAFQITITDTKTLWLGDVRPTNQNGLSAMQYMYDKSDSMGFPKEIKLNSDIMTTGTAYYQLMTLHDALFTCDQSFINRWGGEVYRHQYNLEINKHIGEDNGVTIREGKNLTGFEGNKTTDDLCTVAVGKGYDGILGDYIESSLKNKYDRAYVKVIEYSDVKVRTESDSEETDDNSMLFDTLEDAKAELNKRIKNEFKNNKIDEIKATYNINFIDLSKTDKYKDYVQAERLFLGDNLNVIVPSLGITLKTRVISKEVDYLQSRVTKMTVSNVPVNVEKTDSQIVANIRNMLKENNNINLGEYVNTVIKGGMKNSNVIVRQNELLIMDTDNPKTCKRVWRFNLNGCAYSNTGYNGQYQYGFTMDGVFNASMIQTGILSTILIQNMDGSFKIDLSGTGGAKYFTDGQLAMNMKGNSLLFYNWAKNGDYIGEIGAYCRTTDKFPNGDPDKPIITLTNDLDSAVTIAYKIKDNGDTRAYIDFDKYNVLGNNVPICFKENVSLKNNLLYFGDNNQVEMFNSTTNYLCTKVSNGFEIYHKKTNHCIFHAEGVNAYFSDWENGESYASFSKDYFVLPGLFRATNTHAIVAENDFVCNGKKNRAVKTENFGTVLQNAYETCECYFGDIQETVIPATGELKVQMDKKFLETVNTEVPYQVFTTKYGVGDIYVSERNKDNFIIKGTPNLNFCYEVKAKQKGYEKDRLEGFKEPSFIMPKKE